MGEATDEVRYNNLSDNTAFERESSVDSGSDTTEIRSNIEQTRADMSQTIEAIQEKLNPTHIKEQVQDQVREQFEEAKATVRDATIGKAETMVRQAGDTVSEARYTIMDTIRHNPIPAALVGIGLSWLFMNGRSASSRRSQSYNDESYYGNQYRDQYYAGQPGYVSGSYATGARAYSEPNAIQRGQQAVGGTVQRAQDKAGDVASKVQDTMGSIADRAQNTAGSIADRAQNTAGNIADTAGSIANQAQYQAQRLEDRFQNALVENPLAVGAISLAVGAAIGLAVPQTRREHEVLGEARDTLVERAQSVAQDTVEKVQQVAGQVVDQAETTVKEQARERGLTSK